MITTKKKIINYGVKNTYQSNSRILELVNRYINPPRTFQHISHIFNKKQTLSRNDYFNIINDIAQEQYCINNMCDGIECLIIIDSERSRIYYITKSDTKEYDTDIKDKTAIISAIKLISRPPLDNFIIRRVIVDNELVKYNSVKQINDANEIYSKLLGLRYAIYSDITEHNYKKQIAKYKPNIKNNASYIEFSKINCAISDIIYYWTQYQPPITFYCRKCPLSSVSLYTRAPKNHTLYILFLTITDRDLNTAGLNKLPFHDVLFGHHKGYHQPIHFSPSTFPNAYLFYSDINNLDNQYVKLAFNYNKKEWIFIDISSIESTDKYGDDFKTTELNIWNTYRNPMPYEDLIIDKSKINSQMYFVSRKNKIHEAPIKLNNFCKISLITEYAKNNSTIIDLASGRASDLMTYRNVNPAELLFCEIDRDAVDEALIRKYTFNNPHGTQLKIFNTDLNLSHKINIDQIKNNYCGQLFTNAFCFFALHYLTDTSARIKNIANLISSILDNQGKFIYTAFDRSTVIDLLNKNNGKWEVFEGGEKKYSIIDARNKSGGKPSAKKSSAKKSSAKKSSTKNIEEKTGARNNTAYPIKLILPFNSNTFYYDENLIDDITLDKIFKEHKLEVVKEGSFAEFLEKFRHKKINFYNMLTSADKIFISLYKYKIYEKV